MQLPVVSTLRSFLHRRALLRHLKAAEHELHAAEPGQHSILLDRLGDLHLELGDRREALAYFGGAVDASLSAGHLDSAAALCRKMVTLFPDVVRAHGTLGLLLLARGSIRQAEWELVQYVKAARREGTAGYARDRLRMLVRAYSDHSARILLARLLREMGDPGIAREIEDSMDPDLSETSQRRLLASMLRRTVLPHMLRPANMAEAYSWELDSDAPDPAVEGAPVVELPVMDTALSRASAARTQPVVRPPTATDLPWLDITLPDPPPELTAVPAQPAQPLEVDFQGEHETVPAEPAPAEHALSADECARIAERILAAIRSEIASQQEAIRALPTGQPCTDAPAPRGRGPALFMGPRSLKLRLSRDGIPPDQPLN